MDRNRVTDGPRLHAGWATGKAGLLPEFHVRPRRRAFAVPKARWIAGIAASLALVLPLAAPANAAVPSTLTDPGSPEVLYSVTPGVGSTTGTSTCSPDDSGTFTFHSTGITYGPYPGTFTEDGTVIVGTGPSPTGPGNAPHDVTGFSATFTIESGATVITGTKSFAPTGEYSAGSSGRCSTGLVGTFFDQSFALVNVTYQATITQPGSPPSVDQGSGGANISIPGSTSQAQPSFGSLYEDFFSAAIATVSATLPAGGGTVSTGLDATAAVPVQTTVNFPTSGTVSITEYPQTTTPPPSSYSFFRTEVVIQTTPTPYNGPAFTVELRIDLATLTAQGLDETTVQIARDGAVLSSCADTPVPCVSTRTVDAITSDAVITVLTDHASHWNRAKHLPFNFTGFFAPIKTFPLMTTATAGTVVPYKFSLGGEQGLGAVASAKYGVTDCGSFDPPASLVTAPGALSYNATTGRYTFGWRTTKAMAGSCVQFVLRLSDGTPHLANVKLTR